MKKSLLASTLILLLSVSQCFAISFSKAIVLPGDSAYESNTLKSWEDEWMMAEGDSVQLYISLSDVPEPLITAGFMIEFDPTQISIVNANIFGDCWDRGMSQIIHRDNGSILVTAGNLSLCAPDDAGDIGVASIQFGCVDTCDGVITVKTVPGFDSVVGNSAGVYDSNISPNYFDLNPPPISVQPEQVWRSRWIPLPYLMIIEGEQISKQSFVDLIYYPSDTLLPFPPIAFNEHFIWSFIWVMPGIESQTVTATVLTENGVSEGQFDIVPIGFPPEPSFSSISPDQGEQESILRSVTITGVNTTFQDDWFDDISFVPSDGLMVSNISIQDNTTVEFDLQIDADAPIGFKTVVVTYDDGNKAIVGNNVFEVTEW